jgi:hypothetical protein
MRFVTILVLLFLLTTVGIVSGFISLDHDVNKCVKKSPHFSGWGDFVQVSSVKFNWPEFQVTCKAREDHATHEVKAE